MLLVFFLRGWGLLFPPEAYGRGANLQSNTTISFLLVEETHKYSFNPLTYRSVVQCPTYGIDGSLLLRFSDVVRMFHFLPVRFQLIGADTLFSFETSFSLQLAIERQPLKTDRPHCSTRRTPRNGLHSHQTWLTVKTRGHDLNERS